MDDTPLNPLDVKTFQKIKKKASKNVIMSHKLVSGILAHNKSIYSSCFDIQLKYKILNIIFSENVNYVGNNNEQTSFSTIDNKFTLQIIIVSSRIYYREIIRALFPAKRFKN